MFLPYQQGLKDVVVSSVQTLMVLDEQGSVLTRIWCLYEAWQTSLKGRDLVILSYGIDVNALIEVRNIEYINMSIT